jgi:endo-1,4-beta-mannosidase
MAIDRPLPRREPFRIGVNYWPARSAMAWWSDFDPSEVAVDFARIAGSGLDSVRIFLTWEAFPPRPDVVASEMLERLVAVADTAESAGLSVMPTLFTGHMSGVNWIPAWALGGADGDRRFRVVSGGAVTAARLRNWYADASIAAAQALLAGSAAAALAGHGALWAWDLGNENSNCVIPATRAAGAEWLGRMGAAIRDQDPNAVITTGLHMEDLETDRKLGPAEASRSCDLLSMHGYPIYASWAAGSTDEHLLPFLAHVTRWLGEDRDLVFTELGLPTYRGAAASGHENRLPLVEEELAASYTDRAVTALRQAGCAGALLWCYTDYDPGLWDSPPFDRAAHERSFGLWRADGSPKPSVAVLAALSGADRVQPATEYPWVDIDPDRFYDQPDANLRRLYGLYRAHHGLSRSNPADQG